MVTRETEKMREKIREHNNNNKKNRTAAAVDDDDGVVVPRTRRKEEELRGRRKRRHPVLASVSQNSNIDTNTASTTTTTTTTIDADEDEAPSTSSKDDEVPASIGETLVTIALDEESGLNVITIITWDRQGLMLDIGNALNSLGAVSYTHLRAHET